MRYRMVVAMHDNQCIITSPMSAKCIKRTRAEDKGYEIRVYTNATPFDVILFDVTDDSCVMNKQLSAVKYGR